MCVLCGTQRNGLLISLNPKNFVKKSTDIEIAKNWWYLKVLLPKDYTIQYKAYTAF